MITAIWPTATNPDLVIVDRREAILELAPLLEQLAARCGQPGAMHWLPYFLDASATQRKTPLLVLLLNSREVPEKPLTAGDVRAAALFAEYRFLGRPTGAVATEDAVGFRTVIARQGERARVATLAVHALIDRGAKVVLTTFEAEGEPELATLLTSWPGVLWAGRKRSVGRSLELEATFDETLARMGKSTRFNLRYYAGVWGNKLPASSFPKRRSFCSRQTCRRSTRAP